MTNVYPTYDEPSSTPVVQESLAFYDSAPRYAPTMHVDRASKLRQQFEQLYCWWWFETSISSDYAVFTRHPAFKEIVNMGEAAVPFIVEKLKAQPSFLVKALNRIYKQRISPDRRTTINEACNLWIKKLGY